MFVSSAPLPSSPRDRIGQPSELHHRTLAAKGTSRRVSVVVVRRLLHFVPHPTPSPSLGSLGLSRCTPAAQIAPPYVLRQKPKTRRESRALSPCPFGEGREGQKGTSKQQKQQRPTRRGDVPATQWQERQVTAKAANAAKKIMQTPGQKRGAGGRCTAKENVGRTWEDVTMTTCQRQH